MLTQDQKKRVMEFAKDRPIEVVYLFGSQATDQVKPMSDYDFAVLFGDNLGSSERFDLKLELIGFFTSLFKTDNVDVLDLNSAPPAFRFSAIKSRIDLYTRSEKKRNEFEFKTLQEHLDRLYFIKRHTTMSLATIARYGI